MGDKTVGVIARAVRALSALKLKNTRDAKLSRLDFGILEVALMVAALDGEILPSELEAFITLAKRCRGYSEKACAQVRERALRSAGYLALLAKTGSKEEVLSAFVGEAIAAMPDGFDSAQLSDVRRAFVMWVAMGVSDGSFSAVEREAIEALRKSLTAIKRSRAEAEYNRWLALSPALVQATGSARQTPPTIRLIDESFVPAVEKTVRKLAGEKAAEAEESLKSLIEGR